MEEEKYKDIIQELKGKQIKRFYFYIYGYSS